MRLLGTGEWEDCRLEILKNNNAWRGGEKTKHLTSYHSDVGNRSNALGGSGGASLPGRHERARAERTNQIKIWKGKGKKLW